MKHAGMARRAALKLIYLTLIIAMALNVLAFFLFSSQHKTIGLVITDTLAALWILFVLFTLYFFRDPTAKTPSGPGLVVSPGHGKVDCIDRLDEGPFVGGPCHRISIFLSVINIHVQNAPIAGKIKCVTHTPGQFVSALRADSAEHNENVLIGFDSSELIGEKIGLRLIAGVLARRIVPFVKEGDDLARGDRISLIQFGSRCDLYIPARYQLQVKLGDKVVGGETVMASR
jgi:phosphatidylserine decarboxylase